ncbi:OLC1v1021850C1 [Oldenlandia corymbosa var. corymbosa]|uniref:glutathione transferase n=1 Tax=Oldenlandia corymbosa var. corymbosa TaxID=529605 RepID=A0AAV1C0A8_OLDCO|nr:OLC1v1021850C1 [Oldenlandia corymbosa var. corymbosa]
MAGGGHGGDEVILLDLKVSMFGMRVRVALAEKGIEYEYREENLAQKSQLLLEMNPIHKKLPVLIHKGNPIVESLVIVQYIDEVWRDKKPLLMPSEPYQRAQARFWGDFITKKVYEVGRRVWVTKGEQQEKAKKELIEILKTLEGELGDKAYFGGEEFGFVDVALISFYPWFHAYETCADFKVEAECPKLVEWGKRCMARESVAKSTADPQEVYEFVQSMKLVVGID